MGVNICDEKNDRTNGSVTARVVDSNMPSYVRPWQAGLYSWIVRLALFRGVLWPDLDAGLYGPGKRVCIAGEYFWESFRAGCETI